MCIGSVRFGFAQNKELNSIGSVSYFQNQNLTAICKNWSYIFGSSSVPVSTCSFKILPTWFILMIFFRSLHYYLEKLWSNMVHKMMTQFDRLARNQHTSRASRQDGGLIYSFEQSRWLGQRWRSCEGNFGVVVMMDIMHFLFNISHIGVIIERLLYCLTVHVWLNGDGDAQFDGRDDLWFYWDGMNL